MRIKWQWRKQVTRWSTGWYLRIATPTAVFVTVFRNGDWSFEKVDPFSTKRETDGIIFSPGAAFWLRAGTYDKFEGVLSQFVYAEMLVAASKRMAAVAAARVCAEAALRQTPEDRCEINQTQRGMRNYVIILYSV
jgi:hypothetical protein